MGAYDDNLVLTEQAATPEFYILSSGSTIERYTSFSRDLMFLGYLFTAASIGRSGIKVDTKFSAARMTLTTPITENIAKYIPNQPIEPVEVTVYKSHIESLDSYVVFFKGKIKYVQLKGRLATAQCESKNKYLSRRIPNIIYQSYCNHDVFDPGCALDDSNWTIAATVANITDGGKTIQLSYPTETPDVGYFQGGKIQIGTDFRLIIAHSLVDTIAIHVPFDTRLYVGVTVIVYPGCDGAPSTCVNRFNNKRNFLGMPYIPDTNPAIWGFR